MWVSISVAPNTASLYFGQIYLPFPLSCACFCDLWCGFFSACFLSLIFLLIRCFWHSPVLAAPENLIFFHRQSVAFSFSKWGYAYWVKSGIRFPFCFSMFLFLFLFFHLLLFLRLISSFVGFMLFHFSFCVSVSILPTKGKQLFSIFIHLITLQCKYVFFSLIRRSCWSSFLVFFFWLFTEN